MFYLFLENLENTCLALTAEAGTYSRGFLSAGVNKENLLP